jgi:hydroxymethylpyrimidine pyrophosphatase-like HAD family hydrolase
MEDKMIFFTDLDRTIIYSKRFIHSSEQVVLVERDGEKEIAFMTVKGLEILRELAGKITVIPVTTRNYLEYNRIQLLNELGLEYCIINNGAEILHRGKRDEDYSAMIKCEINRIPYDFDSALQKFFDVFNCKDVKLYRLSDGFLWVIVMKSDDFDRSLLSRLDEKMKVRGWSVSATGKKIYLIPSAISKWTAVRYLKEKLSNEPIICAGDSFMDKEMIENADIGIIPLESEIIGVLPSIRKTCSTGIKAGEEILKFVKDICNGKNDLQSPNNTCTNAKK